MDINLKSIITCPDCGFNKMEVMPTDYCQYSYKCSNCETILKPKEGDCCVYCSFATQNCPPMQKNQNCCG